ncbi:MAG: tetratricopeptide repeat protein [Candidatus Krumholzibacteriia bacterium]
MSDRHKIEELEARAARAPDGTPEKVDALNELARECAVDYPQKSLDTSAYTLQMARELTYAKGEAMALANLGFAHYLFSNHESALARALEATALFEELGDIEGRSAASFVLSMVHRSLGDYDRALANAYEGLKLSRTTGNRAFEGWSLNGIGGIYHDMGDYERALQLQRESLEILDDLKLTVGKARALNDIGSVYQSMEQYEKARAYQEQSLELFRGARNKLGEARALNDLGLIHQHVGEYDKALELFSRSLELREEVGNKQARSTSLINLGNLYIEKKEVEKAFGVLHRALTIAMEIKAKPRIYQANLSLSEAHALNGDYAYALQHYKIYQQVKEEVAGDQANSRIKNLEIALETEQSQKEAEISRLRNVELKQKNEQLRSLLRELRDTEAQLVQSEKMAALGKLVAGVVHELNSPLGAINSAVDTSARRIGRIVETIENNGALSDPPGNGRLRETLAMLASDNSVTVEASERITRIVNSLKSFVQLDRAALQYTDLHEGIDNTLTLMKHDLENRIELVKKYGSLKHVRSNPGELNQVFINLLTNAAQAIDGAGTITIQTYMKEGKAHVAFSDTGVGMPGEQVEKLFEPAISRRGARAKAGLGLFSSYNIMKKHGGDIEVTSRIGSGSTFTLVLPAEDDAEN